MADEQYTWLDADAAERLLRGEPLEAVDEDIREQVERLAAVLGALAPDPAPNAAEPALNSAEALPDSAELPGEAAALAAFRKARDSGEGAAARPGRRAPACSAPPVADAGLVRIGRPAAPRRRTRWARPTRFGLAAMLAVGMVGGIAVAAGTGALPTPFTREHPDPAASVTAIRTPDRPLDSPAPTVSGGIGSVLPTPGAPSGRPSGSAATPARPDTGEASGRPVGEATARAGRSPVWLGRARAYCRDVLDGRSVEDERRQALEHAAGGGNRVRLYCATLLGRRAGTGAGDGKGAGKGVGNGGDSKGGGHGSGQDDQDGQDGQGGRGDHGDQGDDDGHHGGRGGGRHGGRGATAPAHPGLTRFLPVRPAKSPFPSPWPTPTPAATTTP
ncbi:hypothetical protein AB0912_20635 [Streptomyces sp. NPDC007084]|uniref:hypothetical protein n=1 Tax=Streptomyces sp. NPDC007084 TaxID=3154313 RepID=UPI003454C2D1